MTTIFHIAAAHAWREAQAAGRYEPASLRSEGFIHCSTREQIVHVANAWFRGRPDLVLLHIAEDRVEAEIRYEDCEGGDRLFPHIYGPLCVDAVLRADAFAPGADGRFATPEGDDL